MGQPLTIQPQDDAQINRLKLRMKARSKIDVVRAGLSLLQRELDREDRVRRWREAVGEVRDTSREANRAFQAHSRLKRL